MRQSRGCGRRWPISLVEGWTESPDLEVHDRQPPVTSEGSDADGSGAGISLAGGDGKSEAGCNSLGQAVAGDVGQLGGANTNGVAREMRHPCERPSVSNWSEW